LTDLRRDSRDCLAHRPRQTEFDLVSTVT
jgi:hypothetical protein